MRAPRIPKRSLWIGCEQGIASGGSFVVFCLLARRLGPTEFGVLLGIYAVVVLFGIMPSAYASIALSTFRTSTENEALLAGVVLRRMARALWPSVVLLPLLVFCLPAGGRITIYSALVGSSFAVGMATSDYLRRYLIRLDRLELSCLCMLVRWGVTVLVVIGLMPDRPTFEFGLTALCFGICCALLVAAVAVQLAKLNVATAVDAKLNRDMNDLARPLLFQKGITTGSGVLLAAIIPFFVGMGAFGAHQAVLRATGFLMIVGQIADWHYSTRLARRGINYSRTICIQNIVLGTSALGCVALSLVATPIMQLLFGREYAPFGSLLPLVLFQQTCTMLTQVALTELRSLGQHRIYYYIGVWQAAVVMTIAVPLLITSDITIAAIWLLAGSVIQYVTTRVVLRQWRAAGQVSPAGGQKEPKVGKVDASRGARGVQPAA